MAAEAILAVFDSEADAYEIKNAYDSLQKLLDPLLALRTGSANEALRPLARTLGPFVTRLVKCLGSKLAPEHKFCQEQLVLLGDAACLALDALDCLRPVLKATRHELDVQRYTFMRKLTALGLHKQAMAQGTLLHASVSGGPGSVSGPDDLHIAAVANMLVCYCELVHTNAASACALWASVGGPVGGLLALARDSVNADEAGTRMLPVLKCLSKVSDMLQSTEVVGNLGPKAVALQLVSLVACGEICHQQDAVQQMLLDDASGASEAVERNLLEALLWQLETEGSLPSALRSLMHQLSLNLVQKKASFMAPASDRANKGYALTAVVCSALQLQHSLSAEPRGNQLPDILATLSHARKALAGSQGVLGGQDDRWMRWICLDILRASIASVLAQLASGPQLAGGQLQALTDCMEVLGEESLSLLDRTDGPAASVLPSACSAVTIAVRLSAVHSICTGRLSGLHDDMARYVGLLHRLMQQSPASPRAGVISGVGAATLQGLSASLCNTGLDLLQQQHIAAAAELLRAAADLAISRIRQLTSSGSVLVVAELLQLVKKCKAHVAALQQLSDHTGAMAAAATYVANLHTFLDGDVRYAVPLAKLYVRSSIDASVAEAARAATLAAPSAGPISTGATSAAPPAPCKGPRRGGRLQRMQAESQAQAPSATDMRKQLDVGPTAGAADGLIQSSAGPQLATLPARAVRSLTEALAAAAEDGRAPRELFDSLDMYAAQELEVVTEECSRRFVEHGLQQAHSASVLGTLSAYAGSRACNTLLRARLMLVNALSADMSLGHRIDGLRAVCGLLGEQLSGSCHAEMGELSGNGVAPGLLDSAGLAHAQLGLCLAQQGLGQHDEADHTEAYEHIGQALRLWRQWYKTWSGRAASATLRMPSATLHAALSVLQLTHLHACDYPDLAAGASEAAWKIVSMLSDQVKLRDQHVQLLCASLPASTCINWMLAPQPWTPLAAAGEAVSQHSKLAEALRLTERAREAHASTPFDHVAVAESARACAIELERSGFLRHGPAPLLLRSQYHHLAAAAYLRAGDTANSYVHAQEAMRLTCSMLPLLEAATPSGQERPMPAGEGPSSRRGLTPAEAAAATVNSGAVTSAQDYAAQEEDEDDEFSRLGRPQADESGPEKAARAGVVPEPAATGASSGCAGVGLGRDRPVAAGLAWAVAAAHMASLHHAARVFEAAGCVEDATCLWKECIRTAETFAVPSVRALCSCYLAELSCRRGDASAARAYADGAAAVVAGRAQAAVERPDAQPHADAELLRAHLCAAQARVALHNREQQQVLEACAHGVTACDRVARLTANCQVVCSSVGDIQAGPRGQGRAEALLWHAVSLRRQLDRLHAEALLRQGHRSEAAALVRVAEAELNHRAADVGASAPSSVWPVDHGLLLALDAAVSADLASACRSIIGGDASVVGLGAMGHASNGQGAIQQGCPDGQPHADQASKKGTKTKPSRGRQDPAKQEGMQRGSCGGAAPPPCDPLSRVPALLESLALCWHVPLAAAYACKHLLHACMAIGLPHAATMFLHLGQGMSYAQQQALQRQQRQQAHTAARAQPEPGYGSGARAESPGDATHGGPEGESAPEGLCAAADTREEARLVLLSLASGVDEGDTLAAVLERSAETWLRKALQFCPADTVVAALVLDEEADQLLVSRAVRGSVPLLVSVRGHRSISAAATEASDGVSARKALNNCTQRLRGLLEESGDSMRMDQDTASSQSHKAKWWKARTAIDQGVKSLLQDLDDKCLGPWRCLLLPVRGRHRHVLLAAAEAFADEHFAALSADTGEANGTGSYGLHAVRELLCLALCHMQHLHSSDVTSLLRSLCYQTGRQSDATHIDALVTELAAAEAAARVQLLRIPSEEPSKSTSGTTVGAQPQEPDGATSAGSQSAGAVAVAVEAVESECGTSSTSGARVRPAGSRAAAQAGKTTQAARRPVQPISRAASTRGEVEAVVAVKAAAKADAPERGKRVSRLAAMKPAEIASGPKCPASATSTTRSSADRGAARGRPPATSMVPVQKGKQSSTISNPDSRPASPTENSTGASRAPAQGAQQDSGSVLLALSPTLHALPWESIPSIRGCQVHRILSLPVACTNAFSATSLAPASGQAAGGSATAATASPQVPSAYYLLNPSGDLVDTQNFFQQLLEAQPGWQGVTGEKPSARALLTALQSHDLFLYFGHGSGEQFLPPPALRKLQRCAACVLMGCSSGRLRLHGAYDPSGAAVAYILAGCPALVANLWDVTDRDIDRYCQALLGAWLGCAGAPPSGCKEEAMRSSSDIQFCEQEGRKEPLGLAVSLSRGACKLPHLVGAAPVVYGLPLQLRDGGRLGWPA